MLDFNIAVGQSIVKSVKPLTITSVGFNKVKLLVRSNHQLRLIRIPVSGMRPEHGFTDNDLKGKYLVVRWNESVIQDTLPTSLAEVVYQYNLVKPNGEIAYSVKTSRTDWLPGLLPQLVLPERQNWIDIYNKAWKLNWHQIASSTALPAHFTYNVTPDNGRSYLWDASFSTLFQRYGTLSGATPGICTIDNFYAQQQNDGYILRYFTVKDFAAGHNTSKTTPNIEAVNPPLLAWAEWNYFQVTGDRKRLRAVLPKLIKQYQFIESFLQREPGKYIWEGNPSGWDNILNAAKHKYWVELPAMQALSAKCIINMADVLNIPEASKTYVAELAKKQAEMEMYWNEEKKWYCSLDENGKFTQKTLSGMWPVLAGIVPKERVKGIVGNLMDKDKFYTEVMPLPTFAKDEQGYNPKGEYWLGSVWINMSLVTIRSLKEQGYEKEAFDLAVKTLNGIATVYQTWQPKPHTLWECYSPEYVAPASHKVKPELGSVRSDFAGWTSCLINLMIENVLGIEVNAYENTLQWDIKLNEEQGINNLQFGTIKTSLLKKGKVITVRSNKPYKITIKIAGHEKAFNVLAGENQFHI